MPETVRRNIGVRGHQALAPDLHVREPTKVVTLDVEAAIEEMESGMSHPVGKQHQIVKSRSVVGRRRRAQPLPPSAGVPAPRATPSRIRSGNGASERPERATKRRRGHPSGQAASA